MYEIANLITFPHTLLPNPSGWYLSIVLITNHHIYIGALCGLVQGVTSPLQHNSHRARSCLGGLTASTAEPQALSGTFTVRCGNKRGARRRKTQIPDPSPHPEEKPPRCQCPGTWPLTEEVGRDRGSPDQMRCSRWALAGSWESLGSPWTSRGQWL